MAKLIVTTQMVDKATVYNYSDDLTLRRHSSDFARFTDDSDYDLVIRGKNLIYDGADLVSGKVTSIALLSPTGILCTSVTDADLDASLLPSSSTVNLGLSGFFLALSGNDRCVGSTDPDLLMGGDGKDVMIGKRGDDYYWGGLGNDRMTGGAGSDEFEMQGGNDVITDFDSEGIDALHDHILSHAAVLETYKDGQDTVIEFVDGNSVRLLDFKRADFDDSDVRIIFS